MASGRYSFIDIAVLEKIRGRFAAGETLILLSADLERVIWANGAGATLLGHPDVESVMDAAADLGFVARRQIAAAPGFPRMERDCAMLVRLARGATSRAMPFEVGALTLPDGTPAVLLAAPGSGERDGIVAGFEEAGYFAALVDGEGAVMAASESFAGLEIAPGTLAGLVAEAAHESDRLVKRLVPAGDRAVPAGFARLTDEPALHLLIGVDEPVEDAAGLEAETDIDEPAPSDADLPERLDEEPSPAQPRSRPAPAAGDADDWYFGAPDVAPPRTAAGPGLAAGPVRFVWRTDASGAFSVVSPEFAAAVGAEAADIIGQPFREAATRLGLDADGEIASLLDRRDTWSGRTVLWPVSGTDLAAPVDLAALPAYNRDRVFEGFRGFGVVRMDDIETDPQARGLRLGRVPEAEAAPPAPEAVDEAEAVPPPAETPDPFMNEVPVISITDRLKRRVSDKIIRLAEHRPPQPEPEAEPAHEPQPSARQLSPGERTAFEEIRARLRRETGAVEDAPEGSAPEAANPDEEEPAQTSAEPEAPVPAVSGEAQPSDAGIADEVDEAGAAFAPEDEPVGEAPSALAGSADEGDEAKAGFAPGDEPAGETPSALAGAVEEGDEVEAGFAREDDLAGETPSALAGTAGEGDEAGAVFAPEDEPTGEASSAPAGTAEEGDEAEAGFAPEDEPTGKASSTLAGTAGEADEAEDAFVPKDEPAGEALSALAGAERRPGVDPELIAGLPLPLLVHAGDALYFANDEFLDLTGYSDLDELREAGGLDRLFVDGEQGPAQSDAEGEPRALRLRRRDGEIVAIDAHLQSVGWEGGTALLLALRRAGPAEDAPAPVPLPVADTRELERHLAELRTIIDTATDGVVLIAPEGTIRNISRPAEALFGLDSAEVEGRPFASLFAIESRKSAADYLAGLADNGVASVLNDGREVIGREAEGRFIPLFMTIGKLPGDSGYCAVVRDITQFKRAEEELTQARAQAERASSQKTEFLARISHEIRTPLNAIIGFSELMMDEKFGPIGSDRYRDYLRDINRSGNHVLDLVNDLLDISKIEAGEQEMNYEAVSLNEALSEAIAMMQPQANRERVIIRSSLASRLPEVVADLRSVRQIALNLLSNAIRYNQAGGQVIVSTAYEASGDVAMRVRDTGIGMTLAEIDQALKPFRQINALKRGRHDGTGLGLPLTKAMVEANRARFAINSTPGEGTLVEIVFPSTRVLAE
jgi:PAS domain S-box-containing protein